MQLYKYHKELLEITQYGTMVISNIVVDKSNTKNVGNPVYSFTVLLSDLRFSSVSSIPFRTSKPRSKLMRLTFQFDFHILQ